MQFSDPAITEQQGEDLLKYHLEYFWGVQESTIPFWEEMTDGQRGCLLSFSFNCGANFYGSSGFNTITGCLRDKRWEDVPSALMLYVNPGSPVEAGLGADAKQRLNSGIPRGYGRTPLHTEQRH